MPSAVIAALETLEREKALLRRAIASKKDRQVDEMMKLARPKCGMPRLRVPQARAPFFTTKPGGSGIGLALSRQIAEAHGGTLRLENRADAAGAVATLEIPAAAKRSAESAIDLSEP